MISPSELKQKAQRLYPKAIQAWLDDQPGFFPLAIPANKDIPDDHVAAIREVDALRKGSKEILGFGYSIDWQERRTRKHGLQRLPDGFVVESLADLVSWIGKQTEFRNLERSREMVREICPELSDWCRRYWRKLIEIEAVVPELLQVVEYLKSHPLPNCYLRELPLGVSTKLVEQNTLVLAEWLDIALPENAVHHEFSRDDFARRYGFLERSEHYLVRLLDEALIPELQCPGDELSLPIGVLSKLPISNCRILIVENKTSLFSVPKMPRTIALGGLGYGLCVMFELDWLAKNELYYWGDIDVDGFRILAQLRERRPHVRSLMMDIETLRLFKKYIAAGNGADFDCPVKLDAAESQAFAECRQANRRLEQEHLPRAYVQSIVHQWWSLDETSV